MTCRRLSSKRASASRNQRHDSAPVLVADLCGRAKSKRAARRSNPFGVTKVLGDDLLSHGLGHTTIGAGAFHFRVRDGIGWDHTAVVAKDKGEPRSARARMR